MADVGDGVNYFDDSRIGTLGAELTPEMIQEAIKRMRSPFTPTPRREEINMENAAEDVFNALPPVDAVGLVYEVDTLSYVLSVRDGDMIFTCRVEDISIRRLGAGMLVRYLVEVFTKAIEEHKRGVRNLKLDIPVFPPSPMPGPYMPPGFTPGRIRPTVVKQEDWRLDRLKATPYSGQGIC